jgi:hypothetical protein
MNRAETLRLGIGTLKQKVDTGRGESAKIQTVT